jgi:hypothetical protein
MRRTPSRAESLIGIPRPSPARHQPRHQRIRTLVACTACPDRLHHDGRSTVLRRRPLSSRAVDALSCRVSWPMPITEASGHVRPTQPHGAHRGAFRDYCPWVRVCRSSADLVSRAAGQYSDLRPLHRRPGGRHTLGMGRRLPTADAVICVPTPANADGTCNTAAVGGGATDRTPVLPHQIDGSSGDDDEAHRRVEEADSVQPGVLRPRRIPGTVLERCPALNGHTTPQLPHLRWPEACDHQVGGKCHPADMAALIQYAAHHGYDARLFKAVLTSNVTLRSYTPLE